MSAAMSMRGVYLPGGRRTVLRDVPVPTPGSGQVVLAVGASTICGSDVRAIYREHLGSGAEAYQDVIAGHEPAGVVTALGPGTRRLQLGDRVAVYHISGCGQCAECQRGYFISCESPARAAYGWQRDGGHADFLLAEERSCLVMPDSLSFVDGALVSCGFGTAWEALLRINVSGQDGLLVTGLGPVGLAAAMLGRALGASPVIGVDISSARRDLAHSLGLVDHALPADQALDAIRELTSGAGLSATVDCSGSPAGRSLAVRATARWGRCAFVGEGGDVSIDVSQELIHKQVSVHGSWVTSVPHMRALLTRLDQWGLHPEEIVTDRFGLDDAGPAYERADGGDSGKVVLVWD